MASRSQGREMLFTGTRRPGCGQIRRRTAALSKAARLLNTVITIRRCGRRGGLQRGSRCMRDRGAMKRRPARDVTGIPASTAPSRPHALTPAATCTLLRRYHATTLPTSLCSRHTECLLSPAKPLGNGAWRAPNASARCQFGPPMVERDPLTQTLRPTTTDSSRFAKCIACCSDS